MEEVVKPAVDKLNYRCVALDNGIRITLVSDPEADKAAAAMDVSPDLSEHSLIVMNAAFPVFLASFVLVQALGGAHLLCVTKRLTTVVTMQVRIGSLGDPDDLPGLAHFTEHMLFYASEKYPQEDEYSKFVVRCCCAPPCMSQQRFWARANSYVRRLSSCVWLLVRPQYLTLSTLCANTAVVIAV